VAADAEASEIVAAASDEETIEAWIGRRERGEPLAWIIGAAPFCGHTLFVGPGVFVPRRQSEELAHRAAALLPGRGVAADLCTGSGAIAVHLQSAVPEATVVAVDIDGRAADCARRNGVRALIADLGQPLRSHAFDVVTAVAPYVPTAQLRLLPADVQRYESTRALDGGADGLDLVRGVVAAAARLLRPGGWLLIEIGAEQDQALHATLAGHDFGSTTTWFDEDGDLRGLAARAGGSM
jgi:release factor glutamine methyltransferase